MKTYAYGFPRLGVDRKYKRDIENFWNNEISEKKLMDSFNCIEKERREEYKNSVDFYPLCEMTPYDHMLDLAFRMGIYKSRNLREYYQYARGAKALAMKKYFNTNYHYLVPKITKDIKFSFNRNGMLVAYTDSKQPKDMPVFCIGPFTFLKLSNLEGSFNKAFAGLSDQYKKFFIELKKQGVNSIHLEEPAFVMDCTQTEINLTRAVYKQLLDIGVKVNLVTYYEAVPFLKDLFDLEFDAIALDFVSGTDNIAVIKKHGFPKDKKLICGVIDGRNPLRSNIFDKAAQIESIKHLAKIDYSNIYISNSCPLMHLPITLANELNMRASIKKNLSFAREKLDEINLIQEVLSGRYCRAKQYSSHVKTAKIIQRQKQFTTSTYRDKEFELRADLQRKKLDLPILPTTTIGSFPQGGDLRALRLNYRKKKIDKKAYDAFIKSRIKDLVQFQEKAGLDVLVHGEFERTDMVEFFAQRLKGFVTTDAGWVISYGTRVYRPPIVYDEVKRTKAITIDEVSYAKGLTTKPVKGIITGPITILAWSFNLRKQPVYKTAFEIAKALHEEGKALINRGIPIIQIDEPAIRESAPIRKSKNHFYYSWAVKAFNMAASLPRDIQVHTHLCYSEFGEIIDWILKMNFDVITIEAARENANIMNAFKNKKFSRQIGPGVWDIHSKIPAKKINIQQLVKRMTRYFKLNQIWLNPDCGLKTRNWSEVKTSIKNIVDVARQYRKN
jgi:5-methyltetrahydropteroyltriglutamate--homocysteine methyltransferase